MRKNFIYQLTASALVMLLLPWLAVTFIKGDAAMAVCFLLFYAINPVFCIFTGIFAGKNGKSCRSLPAITAVLFLLGTWIFFDMGETAFILYAGIYFFLGMLSWLVAHKNR